MSEELRDKVVHIIIDGLSEEVGPWVTADRILAVPEIAAALRSWPGFIVGDMAGVEVKDCTFSKD